MAKSAGRQKEVFCAGQRRRVLASSFFSATVSASPVRLTIQKSQKTWSSTSPVCEILA